MRISDWSSDVCSSDISFHPRPFTEGIKASDQQCTRPEARQAVHRWSLDAKNDVGVLQHIGPATHRRPCCGIIRIRNRSRSEEHTSELQSLMRISYAVFCLKKTTTQKNTQTHV